MEVATMLGQTQINRKLIEPDEFIFMQNLDSIELKTNHLGLYLKTSICEEYNDIHIENVNSAIDQINLDIFINGVCECNNSVRTLLAKNVVYQLARFNIQIPFSKIYGFLNISKSTTAQTI